MAASVGTNIDIPQLIVEVRNRSPLYDTSHPEYHNRILKKGLWREVSCGLYSAPVWNRLTYTDQDKMWKCIQNKWRSLRDSFRRELYIPNQLLTGSAEKKKKAKYRYFDDLLFLLPFTKGINNDSFMEIDIDEQPLEKDIETEIPLEFKINKVELTFEKKAKKCKKKKVEEDIIEIREENIVLNEKNSVSDNDDEAIETEIPLEKINKSKLAFEKKACMKKKIEEDIITQEENIVLDKKNSESDNDDELDPLEIKIPSEKVKKSKLTFEKKAKKCKKKKVEDDIIETREEKIVLNKKNSVSDDDEAFFRSLQPTLRQFTQDQKLMLRIELMNTILKFKQTQSI